MLGDESNEKPRCRSGVLMLLGLGCAEFVCEVVTGIANRDHLSEFADGIPIGDMFVDVVCDFDQFAGVVAGFFSVETDEFFFHLHFLLKDS